MPVADRVADEGGDDGHAAQKDAERNFVIAQDKACRGPGAGPNLGDLVTGDAFPRDGVSGDQSEDEKMLPSSAPVKL